MTFVLILIILEYIYIILYNDKIVTLDESLNPYYTGIHLHTANSLNKMFNSVLILIILEYIYMKPQWHSIPDRFCVLILIILEYIYIILYNDKIVTLDESLNPYYTGIHLH